MKTLIIVPAYNEEACIFHVVRSIKENHPHADILVINDGSYDNTSIIARKAGAEVIDLERNLGIGGAVQTGFLYAYDKGYDIAVQLDGDGQHDPRDLYKITEPLCRNTADMVIGSRFISSTGYKAGFARGLGIRYFVKLVRLLSGRNYCDTTSGYRAINRKAMKLFVNYYPSDYPEVEAILFALNNNLRVLEIETQMNKRQGGRSSIGPIKAVFYMLKVTLALILQPTIGKELY